MTEHAPGTRLNPLRLSKNREEFEAKRDEPYVGVSGSAFPGDEGTVLLSMGDQHLDMDVEYAKMVVIMLCDAIKGAKKHNEALAKASKVR